MSDSGDIYECQACGTRSLRGDKCPDCGCEDVDLLTRGP